MTISIWCSLTLEAQSTSMKKKSKWIPKGTLLSLYLKTFQKENQLGQASLVQKSMLVQKSCKAKNMISVVIFGHLAS